MIKSAKARVKCNLYPPNLLEGTLVVSSCFFFCFFLLFCFFFLFIENRLKNK